jgi:pantetheine-phosphate adenylyltransferase
MITSKQESIALYPGSFNPWHEGHEDIVNKALAVFDKIIIAQGQNPEKHVVCSRWKCDVFDKEIEEGRIEHVWMPPTLLETVKEYNPKAIIRGLRNGDDLQFEMNQQYWNEDVGVRVPFVYFITDRRLSHVSSSAIRMVEKLGLKHDY